MSGPLSGVKKFKKKQKTAKETAALTKATEQSISPGDPVSEAGDTSEAPASDQKAKKKYRVVCSICKKPNHTARVCRSNPNNVTIVSGGSFLLPAGSVISSSAPAPSGVKKNKNTEKAKTDKKTVAAVAKATENMEM